MAAFLAWGGIRQTAMNVVNFDVAFGLTMPRMAGVNADVSAQCTGRSAIDEARETLRPPLDAIRLVVPFTAFPFAPVGMQALDRFHDSRHRDHPLSSPLSGS
jgi:hypothetical protein